MSAAATRYAANTQAAATRRGYASDWNDFEQWCRDAQHDPLPVSPVVLANYLAALAESDGAKKTTINRRLAAINSRHEHQGFPRPGQDPIVREVIRGIRRTLDGTLDQAAPLTIEILIDAVAHLKLDTMAGLRDRMLLCVGFAGAFRRSELVAMRVEHLSFDARRSVGVTIPVSKTDQERRSQHVTLWRTQTVDIDPVEALHAWLGVSGIDRGPVLRGLTKKQLPRANGMNAASINRIVKTAVARIGLNPDLYSGHSMRAGFVTSARQVGVPDHLIMATTRHASANTLMTYTRFTASDNAAIAAGW